MLPQEFRKKEQSEFKVIRRKKIIKIRSKVNEIIIRTLEMIIKRRSSFFHTDKMDKHFSGICRIKRRE